jgi:hypothetical protein
MQGLDVGMSGNGWKWMEMGYNYTTLYLQNQQFEWKK